MSGRLVFMPTEKVEAVDALVEHWPGHRRDGRGRTLRTITGGRSLLTRTPSQKLPQFPCVWLAGDGRFILRGPMLTAAQVRTLLEDTCRLNGLPVSMLDRPPRYRPTVEVAMRRQARAEIVAAIVDAGVPQRTVAEALQVSASAVSLIVKEGRQVTASDVDVPESLEAFVFRGRDRNR